MGIIERIKGWFERMFGNKVKKEFGVQETTSAEMQRMITRCVNAYRGKPEWVDAEEHIKTINFAKAICSETARLTTLAIGIQISGSARADWLQQQLDAVYYQLRPWMEYGCAYGTVILKPNGESIDVYTPERFAVTEQANGKITGIVFMDQRKQDEKYYTRMEYHRFVDGVYMVTNKCFVGRTPEDTTKGISMENTPWSGLQEEVGIENIDKPLYGVLKMPHANNVDIDSPLSLSVFADALEELKDLDIAYSRNAKEVKDSKRTILLDSDRLLMSGGRVQNNITGFERARKEMKLPDYVRNVYGSGNKEFYQEINPTLNTDTRLTGINALLSQIGYKCGFSNGYFVFNESTGIQTATGVEAEQQRTIQFIKDCRDKLEDCLENLIYAQNVFADLYNLAPVGTYEVVYDFGDITYNEDEDRARWYAYVTAGKVPFWYYLVKFEGFSEEDAKAIEEEAKVKEPTLFGEEE